MVARPADTSLIDERPQAALDRGPEPARGITTQAWRPAFSAPIVVSGP